MAPANPTDDDLLFSNSLVLTAFSARVTPELNSVEGLLQIKKLGMRTLVSPHCHPTMRNLAVTNNQVEIVLNRQPGAGQEDRRVQDVGCGRWSCGRLSFHAVKLQSGPR